MTHKEARDRPELFAASFPVEVLNAFLSRGLLPVDGGDVRSRSDDGLKSVCDHELDEPHARPGGQRMSVVTDALDALGLALAGHGHRWSSRERQLYEAATRRGSGSP